ncbi:MAG: AraC family transcriptional regulator [Clostridia bacterium]|nr:AraC family transcriptional regulator [Clostridia bacterium]
MIPLVQKFTTRQYMLNHDFEFYHYKDDQLFEVDYHNHDFYEVYFFISGYVTYIVEGKSYRLKPGDIILVNNKELHKVTIGRGAVYERVNIWIDPAYITRLSTDSTDLFMCFESSSRKKYNLLRPGAETLAHLRSIVSKLEKAYNSSGFGSDILKNVYLSELIVYLNRAYLDTRDEEIESDIEYNEKISNVIRYINANLQEELSLEDLSAKFFISKYHLLREFKKNTGYTIHHYIQQKRLIMARMLLKDNIKVTEVSLRCGFGDYSNFIRSFKKEYGVSPKKFCKEVMSS